jgi:hypothetical protein
MTEHRLLSIHDDLGGKLRKFVSPIKTSRTSGDGGYKKGAPDSLKRTQGEQREL